MREYFNMVKNTFNYSGRARRREYWIPVFINSAIQLILLGIVLLGATLAGDCLFTVTATSVAFSTRGSLVATILVVPYILFSVFAFITTLSLSFRRYHDTGKPGWVFILCLLGCCCCGIGAIVHIVFCCFDSKEDNEWGANPKNADEYEGSHSILLVAILYPIVLIATFGLCAANIFLTDGRPVIMKTPPTEATTEWISEPTEVETTEEISTEEIDTEEVSTEGVDTGDTTTATGEAVIDLEGYGKIEVSIPDGCEVDTNTDDYVSYSNDEISVTYSVSYLKVGEQTESLEDVYNSDKEIYEEYFVEEESVKNGETTVSGNTVYYSKTVTNMSDNNDYTYKMYVDVGGNYLLEIVIHTYNRAITDDQAFAFATFTEQ